MSKFITIFAFMILYPNAKINLGLNITERRPDGYHNIETVFFPIALHDELEISLTEGQKGEYNFHAKGLAVDCAPEDNLIIKAAKLLLDSVDLHGFARRPRTGPKGNSTLARRAYILHSTLNKIIPFGAGLGGGSSDAAHTLLALNELLSLNYTREQLAAMAAKLGADCPFFIYNTPCLATGIGEILTPIELSLKGYALVLIKPDVFVSTKDAYAGVTPAIPEVSLAESIQLPITEWKGRVINQFETSVFAKFPELAAIKETLYDLGATYASMSGSGSSIFGLFPTDAIPAEEKLKKHFPNMFLFIQNDLQ